MADASGEHGNATLAASAKGDSCLPADAESGMSQICPGLKSGDEEKVRCHAYLEEC